MSTNAFPLDLSERSYAYVERPNPAIQALLARHVLPGRKDARILDIGCGCGANARAIVQQSPSARVVGIEPNSYAAEVARAACAEVYCSTLQEWQAASGHVVPFDAVILSDVVEHIADPVAFLRQAVAITALRDALWIVSVPNYAVWYNRMTTLLGIQRYAWSGLWDRTHLRFYTAKSARALLEYSGLSIVETTCTPSLVQSAAPMLRKIFERDVERGEHLTLSSSLAFSLYRKLVEPVEYRVCRLWPELLGFQVVMMARAATVP
jgi:SAM-dependent methyltransferase